MVELDRSSMRAHLVGGGIASLAAILIRDGRSPPPVFKGYQDLRSIAQAFRALHGLEQ